MLRIRCDKETSCFLFPFQMKEDLYCPVSLENHSFFQILVVRFDTIIQGIMFCLRTKRKTCGISYQP